MRPVDVLGLNVELASGAPLVLLREQQAPHRVLPIFIGAPEAVAIAHALNDDPPPRPFTHDLLAAFLQDLHAHVDHVELTELREGTFHAQLSVHGPTGERRLHSRASDAIALALRVDARVLASEDVLDEAAAVVTIVTDEKVVDDDVTEQDVIDGEVARFRSFLDDVDPTDFETGRSSAEPPPQTYGPDEPHDAGPQDDNRDEPDNPHDSPHS
jgi:bifunctional DNase/RNase